MHNDLTEKRQLLSVLSKPNSLNWKFGKHLLAFAWNQYWLVGFVNICITQCCNHSQVFTVQCTLKENSILLLSLYYSMYLSLYLFLFLYLSLYLPCVLFSAATVHGRSVHPVRDLDFTMAGEKSNLCSFTQYWWIDWLIELYQINRSHSWSIDQTRTLYLIIVEHKHIGCDLLFLMKDLVGFLQLLIVTGSFCSKLWNSLVEWNHYFYLFHSLANKRDFFKPQSSVQPGGFVLFSLTLKRPRSNCYSSDGVDWANGGLQSIAVTQNNPARISRTQFFTRTDMDGQTSSFSRKTWLSFCYVNFVA